MAKPHVCDHCRFRYSFDCDEIKYLFEDGCNNYELDFSTLTQHQKEVIRCITANVKVDVHKLIKFADE